MTMMDVLLKKFFSPVAKEEIKRSAFAATHSLTRREVQILAALLAGLEDGEIGKKLRISERTVRFHLTGVLKKADVTSRVHLLQKYAAWERPSPPSIKRP